MLSTLLICLICLPYILYRLDAKAFLRKVYLGEKLPGPKAYPLIGNALLFVGVPLTEVFNICVDLATKYGKGVSRIWLGGELLVVLSHPNVAETILTSSKFLNKSHLYDFFHEWLGTGLLTSRAKKWYGRRKIITPAFHFRILDQYLAVFEKHGKIFMNKLAQYSPTDAIDMESLVSLYTLDVVSEAAMGVCVDAQIIDDHDYVTAVARINHNITLRIFHYLLRFDIFYKFSSMRRENAKYLRVLHTFTDNLIRTRRQELLKNNATATPELDDDGDQQFYGVKRTYNLVDILLRSQIDGRPLSNLDIREEVDTFVFEGHDTTTTALTFCLYLIAKHADVQRKCFDEMRERFGDDKRTVPTLAQLNQLPYLELVLKESLRLYPPVPVIGRLVEEETTIEGYTFPANSHVHVCINMIGRNPAVFDRATEFIPERFIDGQTVTKPYGGKGKAFAYIPFSAGSRNCIGQKFAELEMKSLLTKMLRNYEISLHPDTAAPAEPRLVVTMVLKPVERLLFHLKERTYNKV